MPDNFLMKGKVYAERKHLLKFPVVAEVKYDEIRLHVKAVLDQSGNVSGVQFLSYAGKPLSNLEYWTEAFQSFMQRFGFDDLDLGVEVNDNFNDSYRWVRSSKGIPKEKFDKATGKTHPALFPSMVRFFLFDVPGLQSEYGQRRQELSSLCDLLNQELRTRGDYPAPCFRPLSWIVDSEPELDELFDRVREQGKEGLMVKDFRGKYVAGSGHRSDWWLKMKPENEADGKIVGLNRAVSIEGVPLDRIGSMDVVVPGGTEFGDWAESYASPAGIEHALGADMYAHPEKYLGRWVEFKYMERDRQGGYRHPSFTRFREDKA